MSGPLKQVAAFVATVIVLAVLIAVTIQLLLPALAARPPEQSTVLVVGAAVGVALVYGMGRLLIDQIATGPKASVVPGALQLTEEFSRRAVGVHDEADLAQATGAVAELFFKTARCAWLMVTPRDAHLTLRPVVGKGHFSVEPAEFSRHNLLLRQLDVQRKSVLQADLEADAQYQQMAPAERAWLQQLGMEVYAPLFEAGVLTGVLMVGSRPGQARFQPAEQELLMLLASQAGAALKTTRVIADLRQLNQSTAALNESLRQTNEEMEKMSVARSDFLAVASHELRTPVTQLLGFADLLGTMAEDNTIDTGTVREITDSIVRACIRLGEVITQILEMAQIDVQAVNLSYGDTTLEGILRQSIEPFAEALRERRLNLSIKGLRSVPPLRADEQRLVSAFSQLVSNAIKYTPDGGRIEITARMLPPEPEQTPLLEVVIADTGIGLDPQYHALIFEKFYRIGSAAMHSTGTTKFMGGGPGLGLSIAKGVIERHGGRLWVESPGHDPEKFPGSRFYITLPIKAPAFDPKALAAAESAWAEGKKEMTALPRKSPFVGME